MMRKSDTFDSFNMNIDIAYKGRIGRERRAFCAQYLELKKSLLRRMEQQLANRVSASGGSITCHKGCSFCCSEYIGVPLDECESIVFYLYTHPDVLSSFLVAFDGWWSKVEKVMHLVDNIEQAIAKAILSNSSSESAVDVTQAAENYYKQDTPCPFLQGGACLIYEVRPEVCASFVVTSPAEACSPSNFGKPTQCRWKADSRKELRRVPFYYNPDGIPHNYALMPVLVYAILKNGFSFLSTLQGLEHLWDDVKRDNEVRAILRSYKID